MKKRGMITIRREIMLLMALALILALGCWLVLRVSFSAYLDDRFDNDTYYRQEDEKILESLQTYIGQYDVEAGSWYMLKKWADREQIVYMRVYREGRLCFLSAEVSDDEFEEMLRRYANETGYEESVAYKVDFADGTADVLVTGKYATVYYNIALILQIVVPCIVFLLIFLAGIRRKVRYIQTLSEEVHILEGGELDHPVTVYGRDELAMLAHSLNELRVNFSNKLEEINGLQEANRDFITETAHDLRTPMTPLLVYRSMLREGKFETEEERDSYIDKAYTKATQLKHMSDGMFTHFLMETTDEGSSEMISMADCFYDQISSMIDYLKTSDFRIVSDIRIQDVSVMVNMEFIARIFDNLVSNILKYADPQEVVQIRLTASGSKVIYRQQNMINELADYSASTGFGVKNIRKMMARMGGEFMENKKNGYYETVLIFDVVGVNVNPEETDRSEETVDSAGE